MGIHFAVNQGQALGIGDVPIHQKQLRESSPSNSEEKVVVGVKYFKDLEPLIFTLQGDRRTKATVLNSRSPSGIPIQ